MKIAINAWSAPADVSFQDLFRKIAAAGFDGIELNLDAEGTSAHALTVKTGPSELHEILSLSESYNLPICSISTSLYGGAPLGSADQSERQRGKNILLRQLDLAHALKADTILVVPGGISQSVSRVKAYEHALCALSEIKKDIEASGIFVGLENVWNSFFLSPTDLIQFLDQLDSPSIGAYFDVGNVAVSSYPEHWIEMLGQRIFKVHIKDFYRPSSWYQGYFVNLYEGSIDWSRVIQALRSAGYDDYITAELAPMPQNPDYLYRITEDAMRHMLQ